MSNSKKDNSQAPISTKICFEQTSNVNPYHADKLYLSGYDIEEIADCGSMTDVLFLMFLGQRPQTTEDAKLLNTLLILLSLPSPRHPASRVAMNSGICKANAEHLLPISLMSIGGEQLGAVEVQNCYHFLNEHIDRPVIDVIKKILPLTKSESIHTFPGFGQHYGAPDPLSYKFLKKLSSIKPESKTINWVFTLLEQLKSKNIGILDIGVAACVLHDLKFGVRESVGLYQYIRSPGLLAYAMEQTHKPVSAIPMLEDSQYELTNK